MMDRLLTLLVERLVHVQGRLGVFRLADRARRIADHRRVRLNRMQHNAAGADLRAFAYLDVAKDLRPGADHHATADLRVAVAAFLAGTAQGHALENRNVVAHHGGLANDDTGAVVQHDAAADPAGRVDVYRQA